MELMKHGDSSKVQKDHEGLIQKIYGDNDSSTEVSETSNEELLTLPETATVDIVEDTLVDTDDKYHFAEEVEEEETLSIHDKELELIKKSLERHKGKRKLAAAELGISERTLYRKIKQFDL
jgi:transcriptional regulator with PAS, ATPase and Fis domain